MNKYNDLSCEEDYSKNRKPVRNRRQAMGMSQKDLAEAFQISDKAVSKWERS